MTSRFLQLLNRMENQDCQRFGYLHYFDLYQYKYYDQYCQHLTEGHSVTSTYGCLEGSFEGYLYSDFC